MGQFRHKCLSKGSVLLLGPKMVTVFWEVLETLGEGTQLQEASYWDRVFKDILSLAWSHCLSLCACLSSPSVHPPFPFPPSSLPLPSLLSPPHLLLDILCPGISGQETMG